MEGICDTLVMAIHSSCRCLQVKTVVWEAEERKRRLWRLSEAFEVEFRRWAGSRVDWPSEGQLPGALVSSGSAAGVSVSDPTSETR